MSSRHNSATSRGSSMRQGFEHTEQDIAMDPPLTLLLRMSYQSALQEIIWSIGRMYILNLLITSISLNQTVDFVIVEIFCELIFSAFARAAAVGNQYSIQTFLFRRQVLASSVYFLYVGGFLLLVTLVITIPLGVVSKHILPPIVFDISTVQDYAYILLFSAFASGATFNFLKYSQTIEKRFDNVILLLNFIMQVLGFNIYLLLRTKTDNTIQVLGIVQACSYTLTSAYYMSKFFSKSDEAPLKVNFANLRPFRVKLLGQVINRTLQAIFEQTFQLLFQFLIYYLFTKQQINGRMSPSYSIVCFYIYLQCVNICNSFNTAACEFYSNFFGSNIRINNMSRVYKMLGHGQVLNLTISVLGALVMFLIGTEIGYMIIPRKYFDADQYEGVKLQIELIKFAAISGAINTAHVCVQGLARAQHQQSVKIISQVTNYAFAVAAIVTSLISKDSFNYSYLHLAQQIMQGIVGWMLYFMQLSHFKNIMKMQALSKPDEANDNDEQTNIVIFKSMSQDRLEKQDTSSKSANEIKLQPLESGEYLGSKDHSNNQTDSSLFLKGNSGGNSGGKEKSTDPLKSAAEMLFGASADK
ncbi:Conserved_hypothetical protein [Hexamita inflata]|uniref:Uncharacterized protein n=1 Tax=Hexamita inflata TaxID=28002 RepID=A0AA86TUA9_9EUKA|nr:Conserved hypothetical protein [Hexamita inflata]